MKILEWSDATIDKPLVVVGFPSQGLVGGIAANYLIDTTDMWLHATVHDDSLPPVARVRAGIALPPIQIYAGSMRCGLDGDCDQLVIVRSDVVPDPMSWSRLAEAILEWAKSKNARLVVAFEGVKTTLKDVKEADDLVLGVATPAAANMLVATGAVRVPDATISGFGASLVVKALERREKALALFVPAAVDHPDAEAAAAFLTRLDKLLPNIPIDPKPLLEKAQELEKRLREDIKGSKESLEQIQENVMYV